MKTGRLTALLVLAPGVAWAAGANAASETFLLLAVILLIARLASFVERLGIPSVLGELLAGVVLGNLGLAGIRYFEGAAADPVLSVFAELGVVILLFQIGLETTIAQMRSVGWRALSVALVGVVAPFILGVFIAGPLLLPGRDLNAYLFLGATLCATSVGITGRVFRDVNALGMPAARIVLGAAVIDDVLGLVILAVVSGFVQSGEVSSAEIGWIVLKAFGFLAGVLVLGRAIAPTLGRALANVSDSVATKLTLMLVMVLGLAWLAQAMGLAGIIGAFAAGMLLEPVFLKDFRGPEIVGELRPLIAHLPPAESAQASKALERHAERHREHLLEPLGYFLAPVFFVHTGMQVKLESLADPAVLLLALGISVAALAGKLVAGLAAGPGNGWIVGWGMVPRGEVGLIFAAIGKALGVVDDTLFSVIVAMVVLTTLVTPPVLAALLRRRNPGNPPGV